MYMPKGREQLLERFKKLAKREGRSQSHILTELILEYLKKHEHGNPQKTLFPGDDPLPPVEYSKHPVLRRQQVMEDLYATIAKNPGCTMQHLVGAFSYASGLRRETILEYFKTLVVAGKIRRVGSKVYPT